MGVIKVNRIEVRKQVHSACHTLITDKDIAEKIYMKIMDYLEDYLSDCEEDERPVRCKDCKHSKTCIYPAKWNWCPDGERRADELEV